MEGRWPGGRFTASVARVPVTAVLITGNLLAWVLVATGASGGLGHRLVSAHPSSTLLRYGAADLASVQAGAWWRLLTSQFLHVRPAHMLFNLVVLGLMGLGFERRWRSRAFAVIYFAGGAAGQLLSVLSLPLLVTSGASQAILALAGAAAIDLLRHRSWAASQPFLVALVAGAITIQVALDVGSAGHLKPGHLGGLIAGMALGCCSCAAGLPEQPASLNPSPARLENR